MGQILGNRPQVLGNWPHAPGNGSMHQIKRPQVFCNGHII